MPASGDTRCVKGTANDFVTDTGKIFYAAASNQNDAVFLEVVTFAWYVGSYLYPAGEAHARDFPKG